MLRTAMLRTTMISIQHHHPTDPGASSGDESSNAPNHAADYDQHAIEPIGTIATAERQAWRIPENQATNLLALHGTHGR
jgi:hypothetical protein